MTIQVTLNSANNNLYAPLQGNGASYAIVKPFTETQKTAVKNEKEKKSNKFGFKILTTTLIAGLGVFALVKGMPKNARTKINTFFKFLEEKTAKLTAEKGKLTSAQNFYLKTLKSTKSLVKYFKGILNLSPLKDNAFKMLLSEKIPTLKKACNKISEVFEKFSTNTLKKAYSKTFDNFKTMYANFAQANNKIPKEKAEIIERKIKSIGQNYDKAFGEGAWSQRVAEYKEDMKGIDVKFWDKTYGHPIKNITNKDTYTTFISEELAAPAKIKLADKVRELREGITISANNNYIDIKNLMNHIDDFIDPTDAASRELIKNVRKSIDSYKKLAESGGDIDKFLKESGISKHLSELDSYISKSNKYNKDAVKQVSNYIKNLDDILSNGKKGEIQEIMSMYKNLLPAEDYIKLEKSVNKSLKSLDKSIDTETDKLFDKIRDILIGSAPLDLSHILIAMGWTGWELSKADNNDERISAALKFGIPAIGAVTVATYCTLGLVSGGPMLIISTLAGLAINRLGEFIDEKRKQYKENPPALDLQNMNFLG